MQPNVTYMHSSDIIFLSGCKDNDVMTGKRRKHDTLDRAAYALRRRRFSVFAGLLPFPSLTACRGFATLNSPKSIPC